MSQGNLKLTHFGIGEICVGEKIAHYKNVLPVSAHPEKRQIFVGIDCLNFHYLKDLSPFQQKEYLIQNVFFAVDKNGIIQSISILLVDSTNNIHKDIDNIYGAKRLSAISSIGEIKTGTKFLWVTNWSISVYLSRNETKQNTSQVNIQICSNNNGISSTDMSVYYLPDFD
jgi:hypothetical protein